MNYRGEAVIVQSSYCAQVSYNSFLLPTPLLRNGVKSARARVLIAEEKMKIARLILVIGLLGTTSLAATRYPIGQWSQSRADKVQALSAHGGIVAVTYANVHGGGATNTIQLYQNLGTWQQIATLTVSDKNAGVLSLALTANYLVAGAFDSGSSEGAAYIFAEPANGWRNATETAQLLPSDPTQYGGFGASVAAYGPTVVVGSPSAGTNMTGAAYVYQEPSTGWVNATETAKLTTTDGEGEVGYSVAVAGSVGGMDRRSP